MKILLLGDIASSHLEKWAISLSQNGIEVGIFSFNHSEVEWWKDQVKITVLYQNSEKKSSSSIFTKLSYLLLIGKIKKAIQSFRPNVLHAHYASSYGLIGRLSGFHPFVVSVWGTDVMKFPLHNFINKQIIIKNLENADLICATSNVLKSYCEKYSLKNSVVIPFGINFEQFHFSEKKTKNEIVIGCVKSLEPIYRIDLLIEAFPFIQQKCKGVVMKLLIVGGGSMEQELKEKVKNLGIEDSVEFTGKVPHNDVPSYYKKMDIFCNLSEYESFGVSIIEAMACGATVISTQTDGAKEIILNDVNGILIEIGDLEQLVDKTTELVKSTNQRKKLSENALKDVKQKYDWKNNVHEMINHYHKISRT
jgi:glycosyltransferase involved in cell wall biosynthesis